MDKRKGLAREASDIGCRMEDEASVDPRQRVVLREPTFRPTDRLPVIAVNDEQHKQTPLE